MSEGLLFKKTSRKDRKDRQGRVDKQIPDQIRKWFVQKRGVHMTYISDLGDLCDLGESILIVWDASGDAA